MLPLPSRFAVLRFKLPALGWIRLLLLIPCAVGMACYTMFVMDSAPAGLALKLIGLAALVFLVHWILVIQLYRMGVICRRPSGKLLAGARRFDS